MRQDIHVHLDLSVPTRTLVLLMTAALLVTVTPELGSENVTLSTYYPAPSGVYSKMITTTAAFLATTCTNSNSNGLNNCNPTDPASLIGIGTTAPRAKLDVGDMTGNGALETVMARLGEGNPNGDGTYLGVKGWVTQPNADPVLSNLSFTLEHHFYGLTNSAIRFYRGGSTTGGYLTFATNNGNERMRITTGGAVGIGNTNPDGTNIVMGGSNSTPNVGLYVGGRNNYGYLYIDNVNTNCNCEVVGSANSNVCAGGWYATWQTGLYIEGWSYQNRGGGNSVFLPPASGSTGQKVTQVYAYDNIMGSPGNGQWFMSTIGQDSSAPDKMCCCPK